VSRGLTILSVYNRYLNRGGEDEVFESEAELMRRRGCTLRLVAEHLARPRSFGEKLNLALNAIWSMKWYTNFKALLKSVRPDVVHIHNLVPVISPSVLYACCQARVPVVHTLHNYKLFCPVSTFFRNGHLCEECLEHSLWRGVRYGCYQGSRPGTAAMAAMLAVHRGLGTWSRTVDCYVALSEFARQRFIEGGLPAEKIVVKPNFVYPDPGEGTGRGEYAIFVGRLSPQKGVRTILAAWERLPTPAPLVVIGDGPLLHLLKAPQLRSYSVEYRGRLPREQTLAALKGARFLVFPSEWYEGFPLTIAEAFACGIPVICSRLGAMREIVEDGRTGLHFNPGDADDLAAKVEWAWTHPDETRAMGQEARLEFETKYTGERNYEMLMEIYQRAITTHLPEAR
jgi:glycosyltransferase involved in cell wall biosynthesis